MFNVKNEIVMEIISIEKKTFEELVSRLGQFVKRMDSINRQRNGRRMSDWMDNQDVCQALKISPRTGKSSIGKAILSSIAKLLS